MGLQTSPVHQKRCGMLSRKEVIGIALKRYFTQSTLGSPKQISYCFCELFVRRPTRFALKNDTIFFGNLSLLLFAFKNLTCFVTPTRKWIFFVSKASGPQEVFFQTWILIPTLKSSKRLTVAFVWFPLVSSFLTLLG